MPNPKERGAQKFSRLPIRFEQGTVLPKPYWLKVRASREDDNTIKVRRTLTKFNLSTVCREAACPNRGECFSRGTATFLVMGDICTRRCTFCDISHGRPAPLDPSEPTRLSQAVHELGLKYVVITSVDRDDLRDGGAAHYSECIAALRNLDSSLRVEILVPDFRGRMEKALDTLSANPPDIFKHNVETVPRLYSVVRPAANYQHSLELLKKFKQRNPNVLTKSGLMLGLGETDNEVLSVLEDLRRAQVDIVTIGQYLAPTKAHFAVQRYVTPKSFDAWRQTAKNMGFSHVFCGVFVRSSYHAEEQLRI